MRRGPAVLLVLAMSVSATLMEEDSVASARTRLKAPNPFATPGMRDYLRSRGGNISAAALDLNSGATYLYRPGNPEQTASIIKVDILATLLHETQAGGGLSADQQGVATAMIEASDNNAATTLWNEAGGASAVQAFDYQAGMGQTAVNVAWGLTTTTPLDQLKLLRVVMLPNHLLSLASREYEYELMRHVISVDTWGVTAGLGVGATVAFKNGWLPRSAGWQVNSIGDVKGSGRHYLIAVMTNQDPTESYGIDTIEHISGAAWRALALERFGRWKPPGRRQTVPSAGYGIKPRPRAARIRASAHRTGPGGPRSGRSARGH